MKRRAKRKPLTGDEINERVLKMVDHLDGLLGKGLMTKRDYDANMLDLSKWANAHRQLARE